MDGDTSEDYIRETLRLLNSPEDYQRQSGAERSRYVTSRRVDERIVDRLKAMAESDPSADVRSAASTTLEALEAPPTGTEEPVAAAPPEPIPPAIKRRQFLIGFAGWCLATGSIWLVLSRELSGNWFVQLLVSGTLFLVNIGLLAGLGSSRRVRWVALGMLAAVALNLLISLALGAWFSVVCFVPFFIR